MRRLGLAAGIVTALALGVMAPAGASASGPVWAYCTKALPKNTGAFTGKSCSAEAATHEGKYELLDGIGKGKAFKGGTKQEVRMLWNDRGHGEFTLECHRVVVTGTPQAPNRIAHVAMSFSHCRTNASEETKTCTAQIGPLAGELGWITPGEAGIELASEAEPGGILGEAQGCLPEVKERWRGSVIGRWTPPVAGGHESTLTFESDGYFSEGLDFVYVNTPAAFEDEEAEHLLVQELYSPETHEGWWDDGVPSSALRATFVEKGEPLQIR
jgi:hypothetical protein